jgi:hypothetical protein
VKHETDINLTIIASHLACRETQEIDF